MFGLWQVDRILILFLFLFRYGHYIEGTGSVLQSCTDVEMESIFKSLDVLSEEEKLKQLSRLKLRYFTPREIANLMGFPPHFSKSVKQTLIIKQIISSCVL